jgi:hypothetical protein
MRPCGSGVAEVPAPRTEIDESEEEDRDLLSAAGLVVASDSVSDTERAWSDCVGGGVQRSAWQGSHRVTGARPSATAQVTQTQCTSQWTTRAHPLHATGDGTEGGLASVRNVWSERTGEAGRSSAASDSRSRGDGTAFSHRYAVSSERLGCGRDFFFFFFFFFVKKTRSHPPKRKTFHKQNPKNKTQNKTKNKTTKLSSRPWQTRIPWRQRRGARIP